MQYKSVLIMAGGTGGHIYPALAVADYLRERNVPVLWLGTRAGLEARVVPEHGYKLLVINISGLRGSGLSRWVLAPFSLVFAIFQALTVILKHKPGAVLGMGGFVSGPGGMAAWLLGIPLFVHEQNAIAGLTNKLLAHFAKQVMQGFSGTFPLMKKVKTTGNPVRNTIINISAGKHHRVTTHKQDMHLLILGGSQGAKKLNEIVPAALKLLPDDVSINVWHQSGEKHLIASKRLYKDLKITAARIEPYIEDMAEAYAWADIVLCRAGALTIAEICVVGLASILVPYPYAVDDHQLANARHLSDSGAAVLLPESELEEIKLTNLLQDFYHHRERLLKMGSKSKQLACPGATSEVATILLECVHA